MPKWSLSNKVSKTGARPKVKMQGARPTEKMQGALAMKMQSIKRTASFFNFPGMYCLGDPRKQSKKMCFETFATQSLMQAHPKGEQQKSAETCPHYLLEALGSGVAREAPAQNEPRSAKLLRPREPEKRRKSAKTEPSQQGFQDRRQTQSENARRQAHRENARRACNENAKHQTHNYIFQFFWHVLLGRSARTCERARFCNISTKRLSNVGLIHSQPTQSCGNAFLVQLAYCFFFV